MRVAIIHDWFISIGGAEKVTKELLELFPSAEVFCLIDSMAPTDRNYILGDRKTNSSLIQRLPFSKKYYRHYLPFFPYAIEQFDLRRFDLIISSSTSVAKGVLTNYNQAHICYCHSPIRYAWDLYQHYVEDAKATNKFGMPIFKVILHYIRHWDYISSQRVDHFIANSQNVANRIKKVYNRKASVIFPPVDVHNLSVIDKKEDFYVIVSRLVPYKRIDILIKAFKQMPDKKLVIIGTGPEQKRLKKLKGDSNNITMTGYLPLFEMRSYLQRARAFVFVAEEDFGITPVEAQACGTPVIAYGKGGLSETVLPGDTGIFFDGQTEKHIIDAINKFEKHGVRFNAYEIREHAVKFNAERFRSEFLESVNAIVNYEDAEFPKTR